MTAISQPSTTNNSEEVPAMHLFPREIVKFALIAHEPRRTDPDDPEAIHCLCGQWFDDHYIWVDHVAARSVIDPAPDVLLVRDHYYSRHSGQAVPGCNVCGV